jgi:hypothetical protein
MVASELPTTNERWRMNFFATIHSPAPAISLRPVLPA